MDSDHLSQNRQQLPIEAALNTMHNLFCKSLGCMLPLLMLTTVAQANPHCNPYRSHYEHAIAQGLLKRPSLVSGAPESRHLFLIAMAQDDRIEAAARAAQYLVIVSEGFGISRADQTRRQVEDEIIDRYQQPVEVAVPMLGVILPHSADCPIKHQPPASETPSPRLGSAALPLPLGYAPNAGTRHTIVP